MITVHIFKGTKELWSLSPFCDKVEAYCMLQGIEYIAKPGNVLKAPKKKLPYITLEDATTLADSQLIIEHLESRSQAPLDAELSASQKASAHALRRATEEAFYFGLIYSRWIDPNGWKEMGPIVESTLPRPAHKLILRMVRRGVQKQVYAQGTARHAAHEVYQMAGDDIDAFAALLGSQSYFLGEKPHTIDATMWSFLNNLRQGPPGDSPLKQKLESHANLTDYIDRLQQAHFSARPKK